MKKKLKVGVIQFNPKSYNYEHNLSKAINLSTKALKEGAKLIVLPELFDSGYCVEDKDRDFSIDFKSKHPTLQALKKLTKEYEAYIIACSIERDKNLYDSAYIIDKEGKIEIYRKIYLWGDESKRFSRGNKYPVFELDFKEFKIKIGLQICYEVGFSEGARFLALQGAKIICYTAAYSKIRSYAWDLASRARALENGVFVLAANRCGNEFSKLSKKELHFGGKSKIINPKGEVIKELLEEEDFIISELDLDEVKEQRKTIPYLKDLNLKLNRNMLKKIHLKIKE